MDFPRCPLESQHTNSVKEIKEGYHMIGLSNEVKVIKITTEVTEEHKAVKEAQDVVPPSSNKKLITVIGLIILLLELVVIGMNFTEGSS